MIKILLLLIYCSVNLYSQKSNLEIQDSLIQSSLEEIISDFKEYDSLNIKTEAHTASWLIQKNAMNTLKKYDIAYNAKSNNYFKIVIENIKPKYKFSENPDSLIRYFQLKLVAFSYKNNNLSESLEITKNYQDTILYDNYNFYENANYPLTIGKPPEYKSSFLEKYITPVVVTSAAIITVVLFFSIRSG